MRTAVPGMGKLSPTRLPPWTSKRRATARLGVHMRTAWAFQPDLLQQREGAVRVRKTGVAEHIGAGGEVDRGAMIDAEIEHLVGVELYPEESPGRKGEFCPDGLPLVQEAVWVATAA